MHPISESPDKAQFPERDQMLPLPISTMLFVTEMSNYNVTIGGASIHSVSIADHSLGTGHHCNSRAESKEQMLRSFQEEEAPPATIQSFKISSKQAQKLHKGNN